MPRIRKLDAAAIAAFEQSLPGVRAQIARAYDTSLADFVAGDYGSVELTDGEQRAVVRKRLHAAAKRRGLRLRFRPGPSQALRFQVSMAPPAVARPTSPEAAPRPEVAPPQQRTTMRRQPVRQGQPVTSRYQDVLPRWMRTGQQTGKAGHKRRTREEKGGRR